MQLSIVKFHDESISELRKTQIFSKYLDILNYFLPLAISAVAKEKSHHMVLVTIS